jgi:tetratricopeptide (TPR) repeat protein
LNKFIIPDGDSIKNQYIKRDAQILEEKLKDFERVISTKKIEEFDKFVPYEFLCNYSFSNNKYEDVIMYYEKAEILGNVAEDTNVKYLMSLYNTFKLDKSKTIIDKFVKDYPDNVYGYQITSLYYQIINDEKNSLEYINISIDKSKNDTIKNAMLFYKARLLQYYDKLEDSIKINEEIVKKEPDEEANKLIKLSTLKELKGIDYITKDMSELIPKIESGYNLACAYAIIENKEYSFRILEEEIKKDVRYKILAKYDPDFKIYKDDEKFNKIIS